MARLSSPGHHTHIQGERDTGVGEENQKSDSVKRVEWLQSLGEGQNAQVDGGADWGVVVERDDRVHLE